MEDITQTLASTLGAGWASGINLYAAIPVLLIWSMPKLRRGIGRVFGARVRLFGGGEERHGEGSPAWNDRGSSRGTD